MGTMVKFKNGESRPLLDIEDAFELIDEYLGTEVRVFIDEYFGNLDDELSDYRMWEIDVEGERLDFKNELKNAVHSAKTLTELQSEIIRLCDEY